MRLGSAYDAGGASGSLHSGLKCYLTALRCVIESLAPKTSKSSPFLLRARRLNLCNLFALVARECIRIDIP